MRNNIIIGQWFDENILIFYIKWIETHVTAVDNFVIILCDVNGLFVLKYHMGYMLLIWILFEDNFIIKHEWKRGGARENIHKNAQTWMTSWKKDWNSIRVSKFQKIIPWLLPWSNSFF